MKTFFPNETNIHYIKNNIIHINIQFNNSNFYIYTKRFKIKSSFEEANKKNISTINQTINII